MGYSMGSQRVTRLGDLVGTHARSGTSFITYRVLALLPSMFHVSLLCHDFGGHLPNKPLVPKSSLQGLHLGKPQ